MFLALFQPQVPGNTGNIGRLCIGYGAELHIIGPCGFDFSDKALRRAGLDYWPHLRWQLHDGPDRFLAWLGAREPWLVTRHGRLRYDQPAFGPDDVLVFGNEVRGLPPAWRERWPERTLRIPMAGPIRSYNLANAAALVAGTAALKAGLIA